ARDAPLAHERAPVVAGAVLIGEVGEVLEVDVGAPVGEVGVEGDAQDPLLGLGGGSGLRAAALRAEDVPGLDVGDLGRVLVVGALDVGVPDVQGAAAQALVAGV